MRKLILTAALVFISSSQAMACYAEIKEHFSPANDLISRTNNIVLAKVISAELQDNGDVKYNFEVIEHLKGSSEKNFSLNGEPLLHDYQTNTFNNHQDAEFWEDRQGRSSVGNGCDIAPTFSVGAKYLIFIDPPYHRKSFERISQPFQNKDKWFEHVRMRTPGEE